MKSYIKDSCVWILIVLLTYFLWIGLELIIYKEIQPRKVDNIISLILCVSLFANYKQEQSANMITEALVKSIIKNLVKESEGSQMSKTVSECKNGYCNFQPVFEDKEQTKFKYYQCNDCGYIMTDDDIKRQFVMCDLHIQFRKIIDKAIAYYKDGNNDEYNDGYIIGSIITARDLGIIDNEQAEKLIKETGINVDLYCNDEEG